MRATVVIKQPPYFLDYGMFKILIMFSSLACGAADREGIEPKREKINLIYFIPTDHRH